MCHRSLHRVLMWDLIHVNAFEAELAVSSDGKNSSEGLLQVFGGFMATAKNNLCYLFSVKVDNTAIPEVDCKASADFEPWCRRM